MLPLFLMVKVTVTGRPVLVPAGPHRCPCMTDTQREDNAAENGLGHTQCYGQLQMTLTRFLFLQTLVYTGPL